VASRGTVEVEEGSGARSCVAVLFERPPNQGFARNKASCPSDDC
jgi:hypothetical protein